MMDATSPVAPAEAPARQLAPSPTVDVGPPAAWPTLDGIRAAADLLRDRIVRTPLLPARKLSDLTGAEVFVKYENLQVTSAFKERGALVKLMSLDAARRQRGVIAMSAGNHAQAVAYHAARLGIPAVIVMPEPTPFVKVAATRAYGARVVLAGETVAEAQVEAERISRAEGYSWVHPYDDAEVIRGQGTVALEMLADEPDLETLLVPVGGGGLISGIAIAAKALKPGIEIVGVETELYPSLIAARAGTQAICGGNTLAEGIAVKNVGVLPLAITRALVDDVVAVSESHIERAVNAFLTIQKTAAEGAGAAGLAALIADPARFAGRKVGVVLTGGNIDPRILAAIMVRELTRADRIVSIRVTVPDRPGTLAELSGIIGGTGGNILEVSHHRFFLEVPAKGARVDITIETRDRAHLDEIIDALNARGFIAARVAAAESRM
ncbi:threonine dehydratase [Pseudoxanthobacter soli DSM 19599]|uniref:Threonine dehydratase n=2 Tax=Pseudoxanthobacter TaxID=433838 RepID=A0A1M7Z600_9HYPH|nr:threonine dehydratase [Pseudoxanthobacter soli DSM 19599]